MIRRKVFISLLLLCIALPGCGLVNELLFNGINSSQYSGILPIEWADTGGTGFVIRDEGETYLVVTAAHVVGEETYVFVDGILSPVVAIDFDTDVAILRVDKFERRWKVWKFAQVRQEELAKAVGYTWVNGSDDPLFLVYHGRVTSLDWWGFVSFDGGIFPGLSGGPLLNRRGQVIGMCSQFGIARGLPFETAGLFVPVFDIETLLTVIGE